MDIMKAFGNASNIPAAGLEALHHAQLQGDKVKILMKQIDGYKQEIVVLKAQSKDHRRSAMIQNMRNKLRDQELVSDVLKAELIQKAKGSLTMEDVNELVIKKTLDGPKRFRPKTREELHNELASLERKHKRALNRLKEQPSSSSSAAIQQRASAEELPSPAAGFGGGGAGRPPPVMAPSPNVASFTNGMATVDLQQVSDLVEQVEALRVAVRSRDITLGRYTEEVERARAELRELRVLQDRLASREQKLEEARERQREADAMYQKALQNQENALEEVERTKAESELFKEELKLENEALKQQCLEQITNIRDLLQRESQLSSESDRVRQASLIERQAVLKDVRAKESLLEDLRKQLRDAAQTKGRMEEKVKAAEENLRHAKEEAAEAYAVKEKLREANVARQGLEKKVKEGKERWDTLQAEKKAREEELTTKLTGEKEALSKDLTAQIDERAKVIQELKQSMEALTTEREESKKQTIELQSRMAVMEKSEQELKVESVFLKKDLARQEEELADAKKQSKVLIDELEALRREIVTVRSEGREAKDELEEMVREAEERAELMKLLEHHEAQLREAQAMINDLDTKSKMEGLREQVLALEKEKKALQESEQRAKGEAAVWHEKVSTALKDVDSFKATANAAQAGHAADTVKLKEDFAKVHEEMMALEARMKAAEAEINDKDTLLEQLKAKVAKEKGHKEGGSTKRRRSSGLEKHVGYLEQLLASRQITFSPAPAEIMSEVGRRQSLALSQELTAGADIQLPSARGGKGEGLGTPTVKEKPIKKQEQHARVRSGSLDLSDSSDEEEEGGDGQRPAHT